MYFLVFSLCLCVPFTLGQTDFRGSCGGGYEKFEFIEYIESNSHLNGELNSYEKFELILKFCSKNRDGLLAYAQSSKHEFALSLQISNWKPTIEVLRSSKYSLDCSWSLGDDIRKGEQHVVSFNLDPKKKEIEMSFFRSGQSTPIKRKTIDIRNCTPEVIPHLQFLEFGSDLIYNSKDGPVYFERSFSGCLAVQVNGKHLEEAAHSVEYFALDRCSTFKEQCQEQCMHPFQSNGTHCRCPLNLIFRDGQCLPSCDCTSLCHNGGTCILGDQGNILCLCEKGFSGPLCQNRTDPCKDAVCLNGGTCVPGQGGNFSCNCTEDFDGPLCQSKTTKLCKKVECKNNGICFEDVASESGYKCHCSEWYSGQHCEIQIHVIVGSVTVAVVVFIGLIIGGIRWRSRKRQQLHEAESTATFYIGTDHRNGMSS